MFVIGPISFTSRLKSYNNKKHYVWYIEAFSVLNRTKPKKNHILLILLLECFQSDLTIDLSEKKLLIIDFQSDLPVRRPWFRPLCSCKPKSGFLPEQALPRVRRSPQGRFRLVEKCTKSKRIKRKLKVEIF